ncbi:MULTISPECIES: restriction endonuclease subunit S [Psychrobacter]|uniref:restriction endonuclease subunit S n=1 Tax=Psychrobacter TaxID=497 RepID=UPI001D00260A|nr:MULTISPECIES: restriction endonuclease subunit S [Psychrobacter]
MMPNGWEKHPVGKICSSIVPGRNKPKQFGGDIAWVTTPEITGKFIPSSVQENYISEETIKECGGKIVPKGAVVMAAVGDLGLIAITKEEVVLNQQLHAFVCSSKINNEFLAYWLGTQTPYMESVASKTTILYLNKTNCESIPVLVPPILEQQKIANILSTWDKAISTTERLIDNSTQQKKALMQQLLTGKKRLLDESGKPFDKKWERIELGKLLDYKQPTPYLVKSTDYSDEYPTPVLTAGKTFILGYTDEEFGIFSEDLPTIIFDDFTTASKFVDFPFKAKSSAMKMLVAKDGVSIKYIFEVMQALSYAIGGHQRHWISIFANIVIGLPCREEQQKITAVSNNADKEIELLEQQLADLQQEKKALMQVLLTGKKRVVV